MTYNLVCNKNNTTGASRRAALTYYSEPMVLSVVRVVQSLVFLVVFCRSLFVRLSVFYWPLYCLSFFDLRLLITSLIFRGRNRLVGGLKTTYTTYITTNVVSSNPAHGEMYFYTTLCDKVCQWFAACRWFSSGTPVSFTNKTHRHDTADILLKIALNNNRLTLLKHFIELCKIFVVALHHKSTKPSSRLVTHR